MKHRWIIVFPGTANEFAKELHGKDSFGGASDQPPTEVEIHEGTKEEFELAYEKAKRKARYVESTTCGFCGGPTPCTRSY